MSKKKEEKNASTPKSGEGVRASIKIEHPAYLPSAEEIGAADPTQEQPKKPLAKMKLKEIRALPKDEREKLFKRPEFRQAWAQFSQTLLQTLFNEDVELEFENEELKHYIELEFKKALKDPKFNNLTIDDIFEAQQGESDPKSRAAIILERAKARAQFESKHPLQPQYGGKEGIKKLSKNNSPLINAMQYRDHIGAGAFDLNVMPAKKITSYVEMSFLNDANGIYSAINNITPYERMILDRAAACVKYANANNFVCVIDGYIIGKLMPGNHEKVTEEEAEEINAILEKFWHLFIKIDATDEMRQRGHELAPGEAFIIEGYCLNLIGITYRTRTGQTKRGFIVVNDPLPQYYAELTGALIPVNVELLDIKTTKTKNGELVIDKSKPLNMNKERQILADYMHRRIMIMKKQEERAKDAYRKNEAKRAKQKQAGKPQDDFKRLEVFEREQGLTPVIRFDAIFQEMGTEYTGDKKSRDKLASLKEFCTQVLNYWKACGLIAGYSITGRGNDAKISIDL